MTSPWSSQFLCVPALISSLIKNSIVAVHGLNPISKDDEDHAWNTWRKPDGDNGRNWLKDDLPKTYTPKARIFIWVYNSTLVYGSRRGQFIDKANELLEALRIERQRDPDRPLMFLAYSLGGILVQQVSLGFSRRRSSRCLLTSSLSWHRLS